MPDEKGYEVDWRPQLDLATYVTKDQILVPNMMDFLFNAMTNESPGPDLRFTPDQATEFHKMLGAPGS